MSHDVPGQDYHRLRAEKIVETADRLLHRIDERFPGSGLRNIAAEVHRRSQAALELSERFGEPWYGLRLLSGLLVVVVLGTTGWGLAGLRWDEGFWNADEFLQTAEAALQSIVFLGIIILFLTSWERRKKRDRAIDAVRQLRNIAHIVDMHQLTKDPDSLLHGGSRTASSPARTLDNFMLGRYLDYCSELLSLISKIGAIYVQNVHDPVALESADRLSGLTNDLSRNIWQKIMILDRMKNEEPRPAGVDLTPTSSV